MNKLKDLKTFQKSYSDIKKDVGGGVGFAYFKVYKEGYQEILDFINKHYVSKKWVEKELIGEVKFYKCEDVDSIDYGKIIPCERLDIEELRNKLKEKE